MALSHAEQIRILSGGGGRVFSRSEPMHKKQLIALLKDMGEITAMTGDGVNDILAMKDADCSVAMASGSEAAAQAAQVMPVTTNFSVITLSSFISSSSAAWSPARR